MARIDYVKVRFAVPLAVDRDMHTARFDSHRVAGERAVADAGEGGCKVSKDYGSREGWVLNYLELWGLASHIYVCSMLESIASPEIMRVDIRQELARGVDIKAMGEFASTTGRRQYQFFNQRVREKSDDRSGGGMGFAKGSHKSEKRISCYQRAQELPAVELQLRGEKANEFWRLLRQERKLWPFIDSEGEIRYTSDMIHTLGYEWLQFDLAKECSLDIDTINNSADPKLMSEAESRLLALDALWATLSGEEKKAFIQGELWGDDTFNLA